MTLLTMVQPMTPQLLSRVQRQIVLKTALWPGPALNVIMIFMDLPVSVVPLVDKGGK